MIPGLAGTPGFDEDDEEQKRLKGIGGSIGEQMGAPVMPAAPPPMPPPPPGPGPDDVLPPDAASLPAPAPPAPQIAPYQPAAPMPIPSSRTVSPAEAANLGALDANAQAQAGSMQQEGKLGVQKAEANAIAADANADASNSYLAQRDKIAQDAEKTIAQKQQQAAQDFQAYREFGIKDPDANQSFGHRILAAVAVGLGAYSQGINGGQNNALAIIQKATADNIAEQKAKQEKLFRIAEHSEGDASDARKERDDAFKQLDLKHAALLQSSADQLKAQLARIGVPEAQIAANGDIQKLEAGALKLRESTLRDIAQDETSLARADIAAAAKRHKAGAGGGGGGGGMAELIKMKEEGQSDSAIAARASELKIPVGGKTGYLQAIKEVRVGGNQDTGALARESKEWAKQNGVNEISKQQRELNALQKELADNADNPLQQALAVEKAVSAARGGAASKQALALALQHLGGDIDKPEAFIQRIRDGQLGAKQMQNFRAFINGQLGASQAAGKRAYDDYTATIEAESDPGKKARMLQERTRLFSGMDGFGAKKPAGGGGGDTAPTQSQGQKAPLSTAEKARGIKWARANRGNPKAQEILDALGEQ